MLFILLIIQVCQWGPKLGVHGKTLRVVFFKFAVRNFNLFSNSAGNQNHIQSNVNKQSVFFEKFNATFLRKVLPRFNAELPCFNAERQRAAQERGLEILDEVFEDEEEETVVSKNSDDHENEIDNAVENENDGTTHCPNFFVMKQFTMYIYAIFNIYIELIRGGGFEG